MGIGSISNCLSRISPPQLIDPSPILRTATTARVFYRATRAAIHDGLHILPSSSLIGTDSVLPGRGPVASHFVHPSVIGPAAETRFSIPSCFTSTSSVVAIQVPQPVFPVGMDEALGFSICRQNGKATVYRNRCRVGVQLEWLKLNC